MTLLRIFEIMQWPRDSSFSREPCDSNWIRSILRWLDRSLKISTENNAAARIAQKANQDNNKKTSFHKNEAKRKLAKS